MPMQHEAVMNPAIGGAEEVEQARERPSQVLEWAIA
jgi:hypothetical protein